MPRKPVGANGKSLTETYCSPWNGLSKADLAGQQTGNGGVGFAAELTFYPEKIMSLYVCDHCGCLRDYPLPPKQCPECASTKVRISYKNPYAGMGMGSGSQTKKRKRSDSDVAGPRCASAPSQTKVDDLANNPVNGVTHVTNLYGNTWRNGQQMIRLAYPNLSSGSAAVQGLVIDPGSAVRARITGHVQRHFEKIATVMRGGRISGTQATEATGEAAAALGMLKNKKYQGFVMLSGYHSHSGTGIDQIWAKPHPTKKGVYSEYVVVEAKGVGATPRVDRFAEDCGTQMSEKWVVDRIKRMTNAQDATAKEAAKKLVKDVGLEFKEKKSKNNHTYYSLSKDPTGKAKLHGLVYEAKWNGVKLSHTPSKNVTYFD